MVAATVVVLLPVDLEVHCPWNHCLGFDSVTHCLDCDDYFVGGDAWLQGISMVGGRRHDVVDYWDIQVKLLVSITFGLPAFLAV